MTQPKTNWRLLRIAENICSCVLTDGFCGPKHRSDCRCWTAARAALQGLSQQANPCLAEAWPEATEDERRARLDDLVRAIRTKQDGLTLEHLAEQEQR